MTLYAKIRIRKVYAPMDSHGKPTKCVYNFLIKDISAGKKTRWPYFDCASLLTRQMALMAAETRGYKVVKTWDEAMRQEGVTSFDGFYHDAKQEAS